MHLELNPSASPAGRAEGALGSYLRALGRHRLLVTLITLAALGAAVAWLAVDTPDFQAEAQILVTPLSPDDSSLLALPILRESSEPTRVVQTAATLLNSPGAAEQTARRLGPGWTSERVRKTVTVEPQGESNIVGITATAESPPLAAQVANQFAAASLLVRRDLLRRLVDAKIAEDRARSRVLGDDQGQAAAEVAARLAQLETIRTSGDPALLLSQRAAPPTAPGGPRPWVVVVLALLAGFTIAVSTALFIEYLDRRIYDEDELLALWPVPVLAHIPSLPKRLRRGKGSSLVASPPAVREAYRSAQVQLGPGPRGSRTMMLTSASTGDGKTTSAVNLAGAFVGAGYQVILIDFDIRRPDIARLLGMGSNRGLMALLTPGVTLAELLVPAPELPALKVVPAGTEGDVVLLEALSRRLPEVLEQAREIADFVIVDTAPLGEVSDALRLIDHVDDLILVTRPENTKRANLELMRDLLARAGREPSGQLVVGRNPGGTSVYYTYGVPQHNAPRSDRVAAATRPTLG